MKLNEIFSKDINRSIEGVVKADDTAHTFDEVEEYVITNELTSKLEDFFEAYAHYKGANGVWISGFFGSGKSHLLKILSYILEDKEYEGRKLSELFLPKVKDDMLKGHITTSLKIPSKSILFNIDQKADIISKKQPDAVLSVFVKVFNEMQGFYGKHGYLADFESDLEGIDLYTSFKDKYAEVSGSTWESDRDIILLEGENFAKALSAVKNISEDDARVVLDKYEENYTLSIEGFAEKVKAYIDRQEPGFRLNFFVDEVGQYIANNTKLMTNLQTIAESLATKCNGQAWVIVTSQSDMTSVLGDMNKQQGNDFSKIQARFANRLNLTSHDVSEVIQKRLLEKNDTAAEALSGIFDKEQNNLKTLFRFGDGSRSYKLFKSNEHFTYCYPFLPYQFELFQSAIVNLSKHNAFQGKSSSVGERSMLGVFQDVAVHLEKGSLGQLATFDLMFEGIRSVLKPDIQHSINVAENNLEDTFAVKILKALFLVKFVKEFKPTVKNVSILLTDSFDINLLEHEKQVQEALNRLEYETYIQRNGDVYEFLTDQEKDIENEIKNTDLEPTSVPDYLAEIIYKNIFRDSKIRFEENKQDYAISRKIDDRIVGREHELALNIITPFHENYEKESLLKSHSMGRDELLFVLAADTRLEGDLKLYLKTKRYILQNQSSSLEPAKRSILAEKATLNNDRQIALSKKIEGMICQAQIILNGEEQVLSGTEPIARIIRAGQELIRQTYTYVKMLSGSYCSEKALTDVCLATDDSLFKDESSTLNKAELECLNFLNRSLTLGDRSSVKSLLDKFQKKPYGWSHYGILSTLASLACRDKVEINSDTNILEKQSLLDALKNSNIHSNLIVKPQQTFDRSEIEKLHDLHKEFLDSSNTGREGKDSALQFKSALTKEAEILQRLIDQNSSLPFLEKFKEAHVYVSKISGRDYAYFLENIKDLDDELLELKDTVIAPVKEFLNGPKLKIYEEALKFLEPSNVNLNSLPEENVASLRGYMNHPAPYTGATMKQVKQCLDTLKEQEKSLLESEKSSALTAIESVTDKLKAHDEFQQLSEDQKDKVIKPILEHKKSVEQALYIPVVRNLMHSTENEILDKQRQLMTNFAYTKPAPVANSFGVHEVRDFEEEVPVARPQYISAREIKVQIAKPYLESEADVEEYMAKLKAEYLRIVKEKRISL